MSADGEACWPSGDDLVHALGALAADAGQYAELVVSHGALVVIRRSPDFPSRADGGNFTPSSAPSAHS